MNSNVSQRQYSRQIILNGETWTFDIYRHTSPDLRFTFQTITNTGSTIRFDMTSTTLGKWIVRGDAPALIHDHAQDIGNFARLNDAY